MRNRFSVLILPLCFWLLPAIAQQNANGTIENADQTISNMVNIIPPSPDAFSFTRYGNLPIGLFTGTAQFSIPVYTISSGKLSHSISLNYSSNGVKVDEMATRVGLNWVLSAGGTITRSVADLPDEFSNRVFYDGGESFTDSAFYSFVKQSTYATPPDYQPDEYSFNVNGLSGKFYKRQDGSFNILSASKVKIEHNGGGFLITGTDGTRYYFDEYELTKNYTPIEPLAPQNIPGFTATAWYLTKIKSVTNDSITFQYSNLGADTVFYTNGISQELSTPNVRSGMLVVFQYNETTPAGVLEEILPQCLDNECSYLRTNIEITQTMGKYLSSIVFNNGRVDFVVSPRQDVENEVKVDTIRVIRLSDDAIIKQFALNYDYAENATNTYDTYGPSSVNLTTSWLRKRLFLKEVRELSRPGNSHHSFQFTYDDPNALPPRLSYSQDKFGYFNGKVNTYFVPNDTWWDWWIGGNNWGGDRNYDFAFAKKGALTKIKYPTGGSTVFEYEPNRINGHYVYKANSSFVTTKHIDTSVLHQQTEYSDSFQAVAGKQVLIRAICNWASFEPEWFPEAYYAELKLVNATDQSDACCNVRVNPGDTISFFAQGLTEDNFYQLQVRATQARLKIETWVELFWKTIDTSENVGLGGIRVKSIVDSVDELTESGRREFHYRSWENDICSGKSLYYYPDGRNFVAVERRFARITSSGVAACADLCGSRWYSGNNVLKSNSVRSLYLNDQGSVTYSKVIELYQSSNGSNNGGMEYEFLNERKSAGKAFSTTYPQFIWNFSPFQTAAYPFTNDDFMNGLPIRTKTFTYQQKFGARTILTEQQQFYSLNELVRDSFYSVKSVLPLVHGLPDATECGNWCSNLFAFFDLNKYYRVTGWVKLDSSVEKQHSSAGELVNKATYSYSNSNYKVLTTQSVGSDGTSKSVTYGYPANISSPDPDYLSLALINVLDIPVYTMINRNGAINAQQIYFDTYQIGGNTFIQPSEVTTYNSLASLPETELTIDQYNSQGNIVQFTGRDGIVTSVIWGYGSLYPVAKVVGADYNSCMSLLNSVIINQPANDAALRDELNKLRNQLSGNVLVSTVTYSPLVGVTSETDANNRTIFYEYDDFNRLRIVRDQDSNILKRVCYNFKGQQTECAEAHTYPATPCNSHNCSGYNRTCINGVCTVSTTQVLLDSEYLGNGITRCTYAYSFENGTIYGTPWVVYLSSDLVCFE